MEERTRGRHSRQPPPDPAATHRPARGPQHLHALCGGFAVGTTVFAPKRGRAKALHYAVAEVTGIQACAGTATVAFMDAEPGVDDEAVPIYTLVPCPRSVLASSDAFESETICSLADRVLRAASGQNVSVDAGGNWFSCESDPGSDTVDKPGLPEGDLKLPNFSEKGPTTQPLVEEIEEKWEALDEGEWHILNLMHKPPGVLEVFFARAFQVLCSAVLRRLVCDEDPLAQVQHVILCVFETYSCLNRFEVYMAVRGHEVHLIDGLRSYPASVRAEDPPQTPHGALWLCLLSEDVEDECSAMGLLKDWLPPRRRRPNGQREGHETPISISIIQFDEGMTVAHGAGNGGWAEGGRRPDDVVSSSAAALTLQAALGDVTFANLIKCRLLCDAEAAEPTDRREPHTAPRGRQQHTLEEAVLELCVPASVWQLGLVRLTLARGASTARGGDEATRQASCNTGEGFLSHCAATLPGLVDAIACGNVFSATLLATLAPLPGGRQLLDEIKRRVMRGARFIGEEAFPVLEAARAALDDALPKPPLERKGLREKRVALMLPNASGATSEAEAYRHVLQRFFYPRHLFTLTTAEPRRPNAAALLDSSSWLELGGVLLLSQEDPFCRMSALQEEADVIIACGRAAAALVAEGGGARCVALFSEVELANGPGHPWIPWPGRMDVGRAISTERAIAERVAAAAMGEPGKGLPSAPLVMAKAAEFLRRLGWPNAQMKEETGTERDKGRGQTRKRSRDELPRWENLCCLAEGLLLWCCRAPAALINDSVKEGLPHLQLSSLTRA